MKKYTNSQVAAILLPQQLVVATPTTSTKYVDLSNANSCLIAFNFGAASTPPSSITIKLYEADATPGDSDSYTEVAASNIGISTLATAAKEKLVYATYIGSCRYLMAKITIAGAGSDVLVSAEVVVDQQVHNPPSVPTTGDIT